MKVIDILNDAIASGKTRFAFELLPPLKGAGLNNIYDAIDPLMEFDPAYINITFHRENIKQQESADGSVSWHVVRHRPGTVGVSAALNKKYGVPTVPHLICGGLSKYDLEDALIDMDLLGIHNVLALQGDRAKNEVFFMPHKEGHSHAIGLVKQIAAMNRGEYIDSESEERHSSEFSIGVAGYPEKHFAAGSLESDIANLKSKVDAGAEYIVTQLFYDNSKFFDYVKMCREAGITVPIVPGLKPLSTYKQLSVLPKTFSISMPDDLSVEIIRHKDNPKSVRQIGIEWAIAQGRELMAAGVPVLHFYTMSRTNNIQEIAKSLF
ncbi:MAG: methylenetetrahydrofolate reductase [Rikenellaceae bacterium]